MSQEYQDIESWREEYLRLRRQIFSYDEDFDVFDCLKLNLKDIRYAGTLRKGRIQRDEDTFNRDLERNEIFSQLQLMKKENETLKQKIQENNPRLQGYYKSEIQKMKKKAEEFMNYHGGNFAFMEEEHQGLEEYLKKFEQENILQDKDDKESLEKYKKMQAQEGQQGRINSSNQNTQKQQTNKSNQKERNDSEFDQDSQLESNSKDHFNINNNQNDEIRQDNQKKDFQNISKTVPLESNNIELIHDEDNEDDDDDRIMLTSPRNLNKMGLKQVDNVKTIGKEEESSQQSNGKQGIPSVGSSVINSRIPSSHPKGGIFSPRSNSHYSGSPQQQSVYDAPVDLDSNPKEDEKDLNQLRDCVAKLDAMIEQNGGRNCGWTEEDHKKFIHLYKKYGGKQGLLLSRAASVDGAISVLKFHTDEDILKHIQLFEQNQRLNEQKSQFITDYRSLMVRLTKRRQIELQIVNQLRQQRAIKGLKERIQSTVKYTQHQAEQLERAKKYYRDVVSGTTREYQQKVLKREQEMLNRLERQQLEREELLVKQAKKNEQNIYQVLKIDQQQENRVRQQEEEQIQFEQEQETRIRRGLEDKAASNLRISAAEKNIQMRLQQLEDLKQQKPKHPSSSYKYYTPQIKRKQLSRPLSYLLQP